MGNKKNAKINRAHSLRKFSRIRRLDNQTNTVVTDEAGEGVAATQFQEGNALSYCICDNMAVSHTKIPEACCSQGTLNQRVLGCHCSERGMHDLVQNTSSISRIGDRNHNVISHVANTIANQTEQSSISENTVNLSDSEEILLREQHDSRQRKCLDDLSSRVASNLHAEITEDRKKIDSAETCGQKADSQFMSFLQTVEMHDSHQRKCSGDLTSRVTSNLHADITEDRKKIDSANTCGQKADCQLMTLPQTGHVHECPTINESHVSAIELSDSNVRERKANGEKSPSDIADEEWSVSSDHELLVENNACSSKSPIEDIKVEGRRIIDLNFFLQQLHDVFDSHSPLDCNFRDLTLVNVRDRGLRAQLFFKCKMCNYTFDIWTDPDYQNIFGINESAVCGSTTSGTGCSTLEEQLSAMSIPPMSHVSYRMYRQKIFDDFDVAATTEMDAAAVEEKRIAIENGHVIDGIPYITVVADGCWAKRSYTGGRQDSLSGAASIVGFETQKVLFVAVRNKFCAMHAKAEQLNRAPTPHICYKNWGRDQSSTGMETDIILDGFKCSVDMHGLIYKTLISDGDSSVIQAIRDVDPYADYGVVVEKVECYNHLFRNLGKKMRTASLLRIRKGSEKSVVSVSVLRKRVHDSGLTIRRLVVRARNMRIGQAASEADKIKMLQEDILTIFQHVFGNHSSCSGLPFPCEPNDNNRNFIPDLIQLGMYSDMTDAVNYLSCHAKSLLKGFTNNAAESFNSILNKLNSGKRENHCASNSYEMRCLGAVVQHNTLQLLSKLYSTKGLPTPTTIVSLEERRIAQVHRNRSLSVGSGRKKRKWQGTDEDYGPASKKPDVSQDVYDVLVAHHFRKLEEFQENRVQVERDTIPQRDSELWHFLRRSIITASHFGPICKMFETTSCANMVSNIRYPKVLNTAAIQFGINNEQTAKEALQSKINKVIMPCGLFIDSEIPYLGASPDGLIDDDGIVEIKCPFSAKNMSPEHAVRENARFSSMFDKRNPDSLRKTHPYYFQVQGQLHVTQRQYCIFALWTTVDVKYVTVFRDDHFWKLKMESALKRFYMECLLPEIVDSRRNRNMPIREPEYVLRAREKTVVKERKLSKRKHEPMEKASAEQCEMTSDGHSAKNGNPDSTWVEIEQNEAVCVSNDTIEALEETRQNVRIDDVIANLAIESALLTDSTIDMFQTILQENSDFVFLPASYTGYYLFIQPCQSAWDLQIVGGNESRHWCCVLYDGSHVFVYDSIFPGEYMFMHEEIRRYIHRRYPLVTNNRIVVQPVSQQPDQFSCGVYAAAFATALVLGGDPVAEEFSLDVQLMRDHMANIIRSRKLSAFPVMK